MKKSIFLSACLFALLLAGCLPVTETPPPTPPTEPVVTRIVPSQPPTSLPTQESTGTPRPVRTSTPNPIPDGVGTLVPLPPLQTVTATLAATQRVRDGHVSLLHHDGQTFILWDEQTGLHNEHYRVYRSTRPIRAEILAGATRLAEVSRGSGDFTANRFYDSVTQTWHARQYERFVIANSGGELPKDTGMLVWTPTKDELGGSGIGVAYYAVTVVESDGSEHLLPGYLSGPVEEHVLDPMPVESGMGANGMHLLIQYMDLHNWNATFHAPNPTNSYYGLSPMDPRFRDTLQYGYDYIVQDPYCGEQAPPGQVPVVVILHPYTGYRDLVTQVSYDKTMWCAYKIYPLDPGDTWWFGYAARHDYRRTGPVTSDDSVANFTERRVLRMIYDLIRRPYGPQVDIQRIYVTGHSMGGTGALAMAERYGHIFAAAYASDPMVDMQESGPAFMPALRLLWGDPRFSLPVVLEAPADWIEPLRQDIGLGVWNWQNLRVGIARHTSLSTAPLGVAHAYNDPIINFNLQAADFYNSMDKSREPWGGVVTGAEHNRQDYDGLPPGLQPDEQYIPFAGLKVVLNETIPALGSILPNFRAATAAQSFNQYVLWSSSWIPWDGAPIDRIDLYQLSLCAVGTELQDGHFCGTGQPQTVNVTPRRLQSFLVIPGARYLWENRSVLDDTLTASGRVTAAQDGTITVRRFLVLPYGSRLILRLAPEEAIQR